MSQRFFVMGFSALIYGAFFFLNNYLFGWLEFSSGVNWVYLPSGLRLLLVLIWGEFAALGITLASAMLMIYFSVSSVLDVAITSVISGASPMLARFIALNTLKLNVSLSDQSPTTLLKLGVMFALISSTLHQLWFSWVGRSDDFVKGVGVMWLGDVLGTLILLYSFRWMIFAADALRKDPSVGD
jgi:hypothetical protein